MVSKIDPGQPAMLRMFEQSKQPIAELPSIRALSERFSSICMESLAIMTGWQVEVIVERIAQDAPPFPAPATSTITAHIPEWNDRVICQFDHLLLFRLLDAMYGGDPRLRRTAPRRPLTQLEQSLALKVAALLFSDLQSALSEVCAFTCAGHRLADDHLADATPTGAGEFVIIELRTVEFQDQIRVCLPVAGLEFAREKLSLGAAESATDLDPQWSRDFRRNIVHTDVGLVASVGGPDMLLSDVAKLRPGALLEFDGSHLRQVLVEGDGEPLFMGRLGQSKGSFTICLEKALAGGESIVESGEP